MPVWKTRNTEQSVTQTSSIINPVGGLGPSVTGLTMTSLSLDSVDPPLRIEMWTARTSKHRPPPSGRGHLVGGRRGSGQGKRGRPPGSSPGTSSTPTGASPLRLHVRCPGRRVRRSGPRRRRRAVSVALNRALACPWPTSRAGEMGTATSWTSSGRRTTESATWWATACSAAPLQTWRAWSRSPAWTRISPPTPASRGASTTRPPPHVDYYYRVRGVDTLGTSTLRSGDWSSHSPSPRQTSFPPRRPA